MHFVSMSTETKKRSSSRGDSSTGPVTPGARASLTRPMYASTTLARRTTILRMVGEDVSPENSDRVSWTVDVLKPEARGGREASLLFSILADSGDQVVSLRRRSRYA